MGQQHCTFTPAHVDAVVPVLLPNAHKEGGAWLVGSIDGNKGKSMRIERSGSKAGLWFDFADGSGGNLVSLVMKVVGIAKPEAIDWLKEHGVVPGATEIQNPEDDFDAKRQHVIANGWNHSEDLTSGSPLYDEVMVYMANRGVADAFTSALKAGLVLKGYSSASTEDGSTRLYSRFELKDGWFNVYEITTRDGHKVMDTPKRFWKAPCPLAGGAIRLFPATDTLAVAEGIETALAVHQLWGYPVWATCGTSFMSALEIPPSVKKVFVSVDHDPNGAGRRAGEKLAKRLLGQGKQVKLFDPADYKPSIRHLPHGTDWLDILNHEKTTSKGQI